MPTRGTTFILRILKYRRRRDGGHPIVPMEGGLFDARPLGENALVLEEEAAHFLVPALGGPVHYTLHHTPQTLHPKP